jgi:uncharacterized membrane protein YhaH (DUF805 family)
MKQWLSPNERIVRKVFFFYLSFNFLLVLPLHFLNGLDQEEFSIVFGIFFPINLVYYYFLVANKSLTPPNCSSLKDSVINWYFALITFLLLMKASVNFLSFDWMLFFVGVATVFFSEYVVIMYLGVGYVKPPRKKVGAAVRKKD